jgi:hypothetical protein
MARLSLRMGLGMSDGDVIPNPLEIDTDKPVTINGDWFGMAIDASLTQRDIQHISVLQESSFTSVSFVGRFGIRFR